MKLKCKRIKQAISRVWRCSVALKIWQEPLKVAADTLERTLQRPETILTSKVLQASVEYVTENNASERHDVLFGVEEISLPEYLDLLQPQLSCHHFLDEDMFESTKV